MFLSRHKKYFGFIFSILLLLSPITLWGGEIVACEDVLGEGIQFEWHHNPHFISTETDSHCEHHEEEPNVVCRDNHEYDFCSGILISNTILRSRDEESSNIIPLSQPLIIGRVFNNIVLLQSFFNYCGDHTIPLIQLHTILKTTILRC